MASIFRGPLFSQRPAARPRDLGWTGNLLASTLGPIGRPLAQADWPNPTGRRQSGEFTVAANLLLTVLAVAAARPFAQTDWPNPSSARKAQPYSGPPNLSVGTLALPFAPVDWANPVLRARNEQTGFAQSLLETTLAAAPEATPFAQNEWSNPTLRIARHDWTFTGSLLATLFLEPAGTPFTATDWPIPLRPVPGVPGTEGRNEALLEATAAPVAQTPSGGWFREPKPRFRAETDSHRELRIKAERIQMGIVPPDPPPDMQPDGLGLSTTLSTVGAGQERPYSLAAHLLPEDLAGLEALAARAAQLTMDQEIALWLKLDEQRQLHEAWLRDEDDAAVLMLAIATIH